MSRIWDAIQRIEQQREDGALEFVVSERIQLTPKQELALQALLETDSLAAAARQVGVAEMTMRRWLTRPAFIAAYYRAGRAQLQLERARLDAATNNAMDALRRARQVLVRINDMACDLRRVQPLPERGQMPAVAERDAAAEG